MYQNIFGEWIVLNGIIYINDDIFNDELFSLKLFGIDILLKNCLVLQELKCKTIYIINTTAANIEDKLNKITKDKRLKTPVEVYNNNKSISSAIMLPYNLVIHYNQMNSAIINIDTTQEISYIDIIDKDAVSLAKVFLFKEFKSIENINIDEKANKMIKINAKVRGLIIKNKDSKGVAEQFLLKSVTKTVEDDGVISFYLYRKAANLLLHPVIKTSISPNMITLLSLGLGLFAAYLCLNGHYLSFLLSAFFLILANIVDCLDGYVARLKHLSSRLGQWLDTVSDDIILYFYFLALSVGLCDYYEYPELKFYIVIGWSTLFLIQKIIVYHYLIFYAKIGDLTKYKWFFNKNENDIENNIKEDTVHNKKSILNLIFGKMSKFGYYMGKQDLIVFMFFITAVFNHIIIQYVLIYIGVFISFFLVLYQTIFKYKDIYK